MVERERNLQMRRPAFDQFYATKVNQRSALLEQSLSVDLRRQARWNQADALSLIGPPGSLAGDLAWLRS